MSNITVAPVIISPNGKTASERKLSVVYGMQSRAALIAVGAQGGKAGKAAMVLAARDALTDVAGACAQSNFRPLGEYIAATLGEGVVISGRSTFEALPDWFEQRIMKIKATKSGGMKTDAATGIEVPGAKLATEMGLKSYTVETIAAVRQYHADRKARAEADAAAVQVGLEMNAQ